MRWIPPGSFLMGSPEREYDRHHDEQLHRVNLTNGFWLAETTCTQGLWKPVMGTNPSEFTDSLENPVEQVSWDDCDQFLKTLKKAVPGLPIRMPTQAEWEYACRAGSQSVFWWGDELSTDLANYAENYPYHNGAKGEFRGSTHPVKSFQRNPNGLYQMHGNVWEWCSDWFGHYADDEITNPTGPIEGDSRVLRGGSWIDGGRRLRAACRNYVEPSWRFGNFGFRLAGGSDPNSPAGSADRWSQKGPKA